jgi:hypothetical protein
VPDSSAAPNIGVEVAFVRLWAAAAPLELLADAPRLGPDVPGERREADARVAVDRETEPEATRGVVLDGVWIRGDGADGRTGIAIRSGIAAPGRPVRSGAAATEAAWLTFTTVGAACCEAGDGRIAGDGGGAGEEVTLDWDGGGCNGDDAVGAGGAVT